MLPPPLRNNDISIVHSIKKVYAALYQTGSKISKRDKLGIHQVIEHLALSIISDIIRASLVQKYQKREILERVRVSLETLKHLVRLEYEQHIIPEKSYIEIATLLIETSKMANGWIKYLTQNPAL